MVEIGSGQGHAIVHAARTRPADDFLAVEVFKAGLARTMLDADAASLTNLRLVEANAPEVLEHLLPAASVAEVWVFFPDPWHKVKHHKRRLVAPGFPEIVRAALGDGESSLAVSPGIAPSRTVLVGARDLDVAESAFLADTPLARLDAVDLLETALADADKFDNLAKIAIQRQISEESGVCRSPCASNQTRPRRSWRGGGARGAGRAPPPGPPPPATSVSASSGSMRTAICTPRTPRCRARSPRPGAGW
ncbi:hypothetical protein [Ralstonia pickettii]|uniref:hypothetical protein n=1 Tax=Ralstonia pickettii TaxID=329 RepID=UPI0021561872